MQLIVLLSAKRNKNISKPDYIHTYTIIYKVCLIYKVVKQHYVKCVTCVTVHQWSHVLQFINGLIN